MIALFSEVLWRLVWGWRSLGFSPSGEMPRALHSTPHPKHATALRAWSRPTANLATPAPERPTPSPTAM